MKIINVVGARPNFVKIAPVIWGMKKFPQIQSMFLHTGQHYDDEMSGKFFRDLGIPEPDINLEVGSDSHAQQTAKVMMRFEKVLIRQKPDLVLVVGDVNSTMACALTAKKLHIKVGHIEAGLRSRDMGMPEEINRIVTDAVSDYLFTTSEFANANLRREGINKKKIHYVGNIMIDTLVAFKTEALKLGIYRKFGLEKGNYVLLTMHRPSNVDDREVLERLLKVISNISARIPVIFPIHPRTQKQIEKLRLHAYLKKIKPAPTIDISRKYHPTETRGKLKMNVIYTCPPLSYKETLNLSMNSRFVITDSGGLQEETTFCSIPCLTIRENTERPETITMGTNLLVGTDAHKIIHYTNLILSGNFKKGKIPKFWDGHTAEKVIKILLGMGKEIK